MGSKSYKLCYFGVCVILRHEDFLGKSLIIAYTSMKLFSCLADFIVFGFSAVPMKTDSTKSFCAWHFGRLF